MKALFDGATVCLGTLLSVAALLPGLIVVVLHGFDRQIGGWMWLAVPGSLSGAGIMLALTLRVRDRFLG